MCGRRLSMKLIVFMGAIGCVLAVGCQTPRTSRLDFTLFESEGQENRHYADFNDAFYRVSAGSTLEIVLRATKPSSIDPTQTITQVLYLKTYWRPIPGTTAVEATQINARVQYAVLTPPTGVRYDGGAFISYKIDKKSGVLTGKIESGTLSPKFRMGDAVEPFGAARFTGHIRATEKSRDVVSTLQMLESQFSRPIVPAPAPRGN